jgi:hypothetical protein
MDWIWLYPNLFGVSLCQFIVLLTLARFRKSLGPLLRKAPLLCLFGIPFGATFDLGIGRYQGIFSYSYASFVFLCFNGFFSYGPAICSAWLFPCRIHRHFSPTLRVGGLALVGCVIVYTFSTNSTTSVTLMHLFVTGSKILICAEGLALFFCRIGPIVALAIHDFRSLLSLILTSITVGAIYETTNSYFDLWSWDPLVSGSGWMGEVIIVVLGYFVLFHPMLILSRLLMGDPLLTKTSDSPPVASSKKSELH